MAARLAQKSTKAKAGDVESRFIFGAPSGVDVTQEHIQPVQQLDGKPPWKHSYEWHTPAKAAKAVQIADADEEFRQRPVGVRDVNRWRTLMRTNRFVHFLPDSPICFDPDGVQLNGRHRFTALAGLDGQVEEVGFFVLRGVPRWMFPFFDNGRPRSLNDVMRIGGRMPKSQTGATVRLAMRYLEVMRGHRVATGWQNWAGIRDEHVDVDLFLAEHPDLGLHYNEAQAVYNKTKINISALMTWRFTQELAWPEQQNYDFIDKFWKGLHKGEMMRATAPPIVLREWSQETFYNREKIRGKRELYLILLNDAYRRFVTKEFGDGKMRWAHGWHMNPPYNPDGPEIAVKNVLAEVDAR
jgi:hypothetical protein